VKARSPAWLIAAAVVLAQASGVVSTVGSALIGIDNAITATIDLKKMVAKIIPPRPAKFSFAPIQPVVVPPTKKQMPKKVTQK